jgi:hypothetical protein
VQTVELIVSLNLRQSYLRVAFAQRGEPVAWNFVQIVYIILSFGVLFINYIIVRILLFGKGIMRHCVKTHNRLYIGGLAGLTIQEEYTPHLVWILDEHVFPLWMLHAKINNSPDDPPSIIQGHV